jgi:hypothetical protein
VTYLNTIKMAIIRNYWKKERKAVGHPLIQGLKMRNLLGSWRG